MFGCTLELKDVEKENVFQAGSTFIKTTLIICKKTVKNFVLQLSWLVIASQFAFRIFF